MAGLALYDVSSGYDEGRTCRVPLPGGKIQEELNVRCDEMAESTPL